MSCVALEPKISHSHYFVVQHTLKLLPSFHSVFSECVFCWCCQAVCLFHAELPLCSSCLWVIILKGTGTQPRVCVPYKVLEFWSYFLRCASISLNSLTWIAQVNFSCCGESLHGCCGYCRSYRDRKGTVFCLRLIRWIRAVQAAALFQ